MSIIKPKIKRYAIAAIFLAAFIYAYVINKWPVYYVLGIFGIIGILIIITNLHSIIAEFGHFYFSTGNIQKAMQIYEKEIKKNTKIPQVYLNYSTVMVRDGDTKKALKCLEKALELKPDIMTHKNILLTLGSCYWVMGDLEKAIDVLESLRSKYEYVNSHVLTTLGYLYLLTGNIDKALTFTNNAIQDSPESGSAWDNLGQIHYALGNYATAKDSFQKAINYNTNLPDSYYYLGLIAEHENNYTLASDFLQKTAQCNITYLNTVTKEQVAEALLRITNRC